jgi:hypothetical protein
MLFYRLKTPKTFTTSEQKLPIPDPFQETGDFRGKSLIAHPPKIERSLQNRYNTMAHDRGYFHDKSMWFFMKIRFLKTKQVSRKNHTTQNFTNREGLC